jgi:hypothetical protein
MTHSFNLKKLKFTVLFAIAYLTQGFERGLQKLWYKAAEFASPAPALGLVYVPTLTVVRTWALILLSCAMLIGGLIIQSYGLVTLSLVSIAGTRGESYWGSGELMAGASHLYDDCAVRESFPVTATTTGASSTLQFAEPAGSAKISDFVKINQYIEIGNTPLATGNKYAMVLAIDDDLDTVTLDKEVNVATATEVRVFAQMMLGGYDDFKVSFGINKLDLTDILDGGESPSDKVVNGGYCNIEIGLARNSLQRQDRVTQGFEIQYDATGKPNAFAFGVPIGELDSRIVRELVAVRLSGGRELDGPQYKVRFFRAAPAVESESSYNNQQIFYQTMYQCYTSMNHRYKGANLFYASSNFQFDPAEQSEYIV